MKCFLITFLSTLLSLNVNCQSHIDNFSSMIATEPIDKKITITDIVYKDGNYKSTKIKNIKTPKLSIENDSKGILIDSLSLIDYMSDTIYIVSLDYFASTIQETYRTKNHFFIISENIDGEYEYNTLDDYYSKFPDEIRRSDSILYEAIFSWNIPILIQLIKSSGSLMGGEYWMSAQRIIIKDNQVQKKDIVNFKPAIRWIM